MSKGTVKRCHVGTEKMNESKPQMTCRKAILRCQNQEALLSWEKFTGYLCYCVDGIRHGGGMISVQAFVWNLGTQADLSNLNKLRGGGVIRSSEEASESSSSKGVTLISENYGSTRNGRSP